MAIGDYDEELSFAQDLLSREPNAVLGIRVLAEMSLAANDLETAKKHLERSIEIRPVFSNNWLMGLVYYRQKDLAQAKKYFEISKGLNEVAVYYDKQTDLRYSLGQDRTVDWESLTGKAQGPAVKDPTYWNDFFERKKDSGMLYGLPNALTTIPEEFRTKEMLNYWLDFSGSNGVKSISGEIITYFNSKLLTTKEIYLALEREYPAKLTEKWRWNT